MGTQKIQKASRLFGLIALGALNLFFAGCATGLRDLEDIHEAPKDFQQEIRVADTTSLSEAALAKPAPPPDGFVPNLITLTRPVAPPSPEAKRSKAAIPAAKTVKAWKPESWPFGLGEKIEWTIRYGLIEGGRMNLEVMPIKIVDGQPAFHIQGKVRSSRMMEFFYKIQNSLDEWVSLDHFLPLRQEVSQNESARWGRRVVIYNHTKHRAHLFIDLNRQKKKRQRVKREDDMKPYSQDPFSAMYFYRFVDKKGNFNLPIHDRWKNWNGKLQYLGVEEMRVPAGKFKTRHYKVLPQVVGVLKPKGAVDVWLADDDTRVMVKFTASVRVGTITGELSAFSRGKAFSQSPPELLTSVDP